MAKVEKTSGGIVELFKTIVYALLLAGIIRTLIFQPFWIPSGSMKSTLLIGDFLYVNKYAYGYSFNSCPSYGKWNLCSFASDYEGRLMAKEPQRGDVVVFKHPVSNIDYIKRLIGLPGDTIAMKDGQLVINGKLVPLKRDGNFAETYERQGPEQNLPKCIGTTALNGDCIKEKFVEVLPGGLEHTTLNIYSGGKDNMDPITVPTGHYFFMGDNRDNSTDSRFKHTENGVGFVPAKNLVGRAERVVFSSAGDSILYFWTWRSDRFFKAID